MHDFLLAKQIIDDLKQIIQEKKIESIKSVDIEIGSIALAHDDIPEHTEDISIDNLKFGIQSQVKNTPLENSEFSITKVKGDNYNIKNIEI